MHSMSVNSFEYIFPYFQSQGNNRKRWEKNIKQEQEVALVHPMPMVDLLQKNS